MNDIFQKIGLVMQDMPAIGKAQKNTQQGWMFRGIDMIMNYVEPLFVKHGVFMVPQVMESVREERQTKNGGNMIYTKLRVKYSFYAISDGSCIEAIVDGEGMDTGDKSTNKAMAVAMKYALFQVLCIPTEEMAIPERMVDPDETTPEESTKIYKCADCGKQLEEVRKENGKTVSVSSQVESGMSIAGRVLCPSCLKIVYRKSKPEDEIKKGA